MAGARNRRRERLAAATILALAAACALWVVKRPAAPPRITPEVATPQTKQESLAASTLMAPIEIVELPAQVAPSAPSAPPEPTPPSPKPLEATPAPQAAATPIPEPAPVAPPPPQQVKTLKPAPPPAAMIALLVPLKPDEPTPVAAKPLVPLTPENDADIAPVRAPLKVDEAELVRFREARAEAATAIPLKPALRPEPAPPLPITPTLPAPVAKQEPLPEEPSPQPPAKPPVVTSGTVGEGRALLRLLEKGSGPSIQIGWPSQAAEREELYRLFVRCFGMRVGLADNGGRLFLAEGKPGEPSEFDMERYSGFVRRPEGALASDEQREAARLVSYHNAKGFAVRVFPREVDAYLMSSLRQAVGEGYLNAKIIHAAYRLDSGHVIVESVTADGHPVNATIDLASVSAGCAF